MNIIIATFKKLIATFKHEFKLLGQIPNLEVSFFLEKGTNNL